MPAYIKELSVRTSQREEMIDITHLVRDFAKEAGIADGICRVFVPHTTCGLLINENADPDRRSRYSGCLTHAGTGHGELQARRRELTRPYQIFFGRVFPNPHGSEWPALLGDLARDLPV
jgi:Uncharacterized conserved protein